MGGTCDDFTARIPYATLIATIMCCLGVLIFNYGIYDAVTHTIIMLDSVFHIQLAWLELLKYTFAPIGVGIAALGFMILCVGFLTTGATRHKVYRAWRARVGGRISCVVFMGITYILTIIWLLIFAALILLSISFTFFWKMCVSEGVRKQETCIDFTQFSFVFPYGYKNEYMKVCDTKIFCKDTVEKAYLSILLATVASILIIMSLIHYLMCLSANYAHIRDHEKFQELQELQYLQDPGDGDSPQHGMGTLSLHHRSKDRF